jgi:hypothetical protein
MTEEGVDQGVYIVVKVTQSTQTTSRGNQSKMPRLLLALWLTLSSTTSDPNYQTLHQLIKTSFRRQQRPPKRFIKLHAESLFVCCVSYSYTLTIKEDTLFLVLLQSSIHYTIVYNTTPQLY